MNTLVARLVTLSLTVSGLFAAAPASHAGINWCGTGGSSRDKFHLFDVCADQCFDSRCNNVRLDCYHSCWDSQPVMPDECPDGTELSAMILGMCYPTCPAGSVSDGGVFCMQCADGNELDSHGMCPNPYNSVPVKVQGYYVWSNPVPPFSWSIADQGVPVGCEPGRHLVNGLCYQD